jgi:aminoglycoside phosphotransferase (APT) family kinase protein
MLNARKERSCSHITVDRKYYRVGNTWVKRNLRPHEWLTGPQGTVHVPRQGIERLANEVACIDFIAERTNIPVPKVLCHFEDDEAYYLITEHVDGVMMADLAEAQKTEVIKALDKHLDTLHKLRSRCLGGPSGYIITPPRLWKSLWRDNWKPLEADSEDFVFCHGDLSQYNVLVDPDSLQITAILDWEYAGFYPPFFERHFFLRPGTSAALDGEDDDSERVSQFLIQRC